jgi:hypothetical protein
MGKFKIAHIREQGVDLIIIPLDRGFGVKTRDEQLKIMEALQRCAIDAGLTGTVVPVWPTGPKTWSFIASPIWHAFFKSFQLEDIVRNLNKELTCGR